MKIEIEQTYILTPHTEKACTWLEQKIGYKTRPYKIRGYGLPVKDRYILGLVREMMEDGNVMGEDFSIKEKKKKKKADDVFSVFFVS